MEDDNFQLVEGPVPKPDDGQFLVRNLWLSFDPSLRGRLLEPRPFMKSVQIGEVMQAYSVGQVVESRSSEFRAGQFVQGAFGWQDWAISDGTGLVVVPDGVPPQAMLGIYGMTGITAYFGMFDIGRPSADEVVVVSGAAGATGSVAGQIARIAGCRTIGIAGGSAKCQWLRAEARFDAAIDYKSEVTADRLDEFAPDGIDVFFDNVGGPVLDEVLARIRRRARIVLCGAISTGYKPGTQPQGPSNYFNLCLRSSLMQGFRLSDYADRHQEARSQLRRWVDSGDLTYREDIQHGLENAPATLRMLFEGKNLGKQLLEIAEAPLPTRR